MSQEIPNIQLGGEFTLPALGDLRFYGCFAVIDGKYGCAAILKDLPSLSDILGYLHIPEIPWLPEIQLTELGAIIFVDKEQQSITLKVSLDATVSIPLAGHENIYFAFNTLTFLCSFEHEKDKASAITDCHLSLDNGCLIIPDVIEIPSFTFAFGYSQKDSWSMKARIPKAIIFGLTIDASVDYDGKAHTFTLNFCKEHSLTLLNAAGVKLTASDFNLTISSKAEKQTHIEVDGRAELTLPVPHDYTFGGELILSESQLIMEPDLPELSVSMMKILEIDFGFSAQFKKITLAWGDAAGITATSRLQWSADGIPETLKAQLPVDVDVILGIQKDQRLGAVISLTAVNETPQARFVIPDIPIPGAPDLKLSQLGGVLLRLRELSILLSGNGLATKLKFEFALPENLNDIFKKDNDEKSGFELFSTAPIDLVFELSMVEKPAFSVQLWGCPILPEWISNKQPILDADSDMAPDWHLILGQGGKFGEIKINSPKLECNFKMPPDLTFEGHIELAIEEELRIPLIPLRYFVGMILHDQEKATHLIPESLPIVIPTLLDANGEFASKEFVGFIEESLNIDPLKDPGNPLIPIITDMESALDTINKHTSGFADKIPPRLKTYLEPQFEKGFEGFSMAATVSIRADGTFNFDISVNADAKEKDAPHSGNNSDSEKKKAAGLRLLYICPNMPPTLQGITFRRLAFGTVFGDLFFRLIVDADFDQFDLLSLAASVALPQNTILPISRELQQTLTVRNLKALIEYETEIPIPIPYYFDEIGYDYSDILGFGIHGHILFRKPEFELGTLISVFSQCASFVTDPAASLELPVEKMSRLLPALQLSNCYLKYPEFISKDGYLGYRDKDPETPFWSSDKAIGTPLIRWTQDALNTIKFFSIVQFIKSIPQEQRCRLLATDTPDAKPLNFAGLDLKAEIGWVLTSPDDYNTHKQDYAATIGESAGLEALAVSILGNDWVQEDAAMIFLKTEVVVAPLAGLTMRFALVTTDSKTSCSLQGQKTRNGMATAFQLHGNVLALVLDLRGTLLVQTSPVVHIHATGSGDIFFGKWKLFECVGEIDIREDGFSCVGTVTVLPDMGKDVLSVKEQCEISRANGVHLALTLQALSFYGLNLFGVDFLVCHSEGATCVSYKGSFMLTAVSLSVTNTPELLLIRTHSSFAFGSLANNSIHIEHDWGNGSGASVLSGGFLEVLGPLATSYKALFSNQANVQSSLRITLAGTYTIILGLTADGQQYIISGRFNLFPPEFPVQCGCKVTGGALSSEGISFTSTSEITILGTGLSMTLHFDVGSIIIAASVKLAGVQISAANGMVTTWKSLPAFCLSYTTNFLWLTTYWYIGISIDGPYLATRPPGYWRSPQTKMKALGGARVLKNTDLMSGYPATGPASTVAEFEPTAPPLVDGILVLEIIRNIIDSGEPGLSTKDGLKKYEGLFFVYHLSVEELMASKTQKKFTRLTVVQTPEAVAMGDKNFFREVIALANDQIKQIEQKETIIQKLSAIDSVQFDIDRKTNKITAHWLDKNSREIVSVEFSSSTITFTVIVSATLSCLG